MFKGHWGIVIMKLVLLIGILVASASCLLTSRHFAKMGINVTDGVYQEINPLSIDVTTVCNDVVLNQPPYDYNGTVKSGYLNVGASKGSSALAFIFYGKQGVSKTELYKYPTIIWLNGGPGSSSQMGNLMELGPFWIVEDDKQPYKIVRNAHAWTKEYNVLFVDQPVGTGLSYADPRVSDPYTHNMTDVANDFYEALHTMYSSSSACFKDLNITGDRDLYIMGESYAGKYVPAIASKIVAEKEKGGIITGLKGVAIGDGFTHPFHIMSQLGAFSYNLGLLDYEERTKIEQILINAAFQVRSNRWKELHISFQKAMDSIVEWSGGVNVYDFTKYKDYPSQLIQEYFWNPDVKKLFKLNNQIQFGQQGANVYEALYEDFMKPYVDTVEYLLKMNLPVLIYNGQNDLIVQSPGTMKWVDQIFYKDSGSFKDTLFSPWKVNGKTAGSHKKVGKLELKIVNNAGHLVPMDQGQNALQMVKEFVASSKS